MNTYRIAVDWDSTLVKPNWPAPATEYMPGAVEAMQALHAAGIQIIVNTLRLNPFNPTTSQRRDPGAVMTEELNIRDLLDRAGLTFVEIWTHPGKCPADLYVDDRGMYYAGTPRSWAAVTRKALSRAERDSEHPAFDFDMHMEGP